MMQYIEAPYHTQPIYPSVFLAGGITNCPDWQSVLVDMLSDADITIFNPRRKHFNMHPFETTRQINWEYQKLREAKLVSFWFSRGSLNPIVLFELGAALERDVPIVIGIDEGYERSQDVIVQTLLRRPELEIVMSLQHLHKMIRSELGLPD